MIWFVLSSKKLLIYKILLKQIIYVINQKVEKFITLKNIFWILFLRNIHEGHLSLNDADDEQSNFAAKLNNLDKGKKTIKKGFFINNLGLLFRDREKVLNNFKTRLFPIKNLHKIPTR